MTREECIKRLRVYAQYSYGIWQNGEEDTKAFDMAIEALQREEAEEKGYCHRIRPSNVEVVVRCKDCKHKVVTKDGEYNPEDIVCDYWMSDGLEAKDFCSYGERKGSDEE